MMRNRLIWDVSIKTFLLLLIFASTFSLGYGQSNPLFTPSERIDTVNTTDSAIIKQEQEKAHPQKLFRNAAISRFIKKNAHLQKQIKDRFVALSKDYKSTNSIRSILLIFLFSFVYGILHSLGPGHGKVFIFSYILTTKPKIIRTINTSYLIATAHSLSGLIAALIIVFTLKTYSSSCSTVADVSNIVIRLGFAIIILLGIILFIRNLSGKEHAHTATPDTENKRLIPFILSIGLVPCPGTIIIVTFLASMGLTIIGIASVLFIILGMGITISVIGLLSLSSKQIVLRFIPEESATHTKIYHYFSLVGAGLLILFATWFFVGSFYM